MAVGRVDPFLVPFSVLLSLASWNGARLDRDRSRNVRKSENLLGVGGIAGNSGKVQAHSGAVVSHVRNHTRGLVQERGKRTGRVAGKRRKESVG